VPLLELRIDQKQLLNVDRLAPFNGHEKADVLAVMKLTEDSLDQIIVFLDQRIVCVDRLSPVMISTRFILLPNAF